MTATSGLDVQAYGLMGIYGSLRQTACGNLSRAMRCLYGHFVRDGRQEGHGEALPRALSIAGYWEATPSSSQHSQKPRPDLRSLPWDEVVARGIWNKT